MSNKLSKRFYIALIIFSLVGQIAWVVENMYFNVFIYKIFNASASDISLMVALSAVSATLTSIFIGALSDKIGKRKIFICGGYLLWGVSILCFSLVRLDVLNALFPTAVSVASIGVSLVIILDCVMTFFGSSANDAAFNAWLTDKTDSSNRGSAEGINSMMPLVAILAVFGGFMALDLDKSSSWTLIFTVIGVIVILIGVLGFFLIDEPVIKKENTPYFDNIIYGFLPSTIKQNLKLYIALIAFIVFNISIQIFMPYLIIYYKVSLKMADYVLVMAPAIVLASVVTFFWSKVYDKKSFSFSIAFSLVWLALGYIMLFIFTNKLLVFIGSLLMMSGYLAGMAVFGATIRDNTPSGKSGRLQGVRIVSQVLIPGVVGPFIGKLVLSGADVIDNNDGTTSFIPSSYIFLAALIALLVAIPFIILLAKNNKPKLNNLKTDYEVDDIPFSKEYPRPNLKRDGYVNLNGEWNFDVYKKEKSVYSGKILVPFPPESPLSRVKRITRKSELLVYTRKIDIKDTDKLTVLHFGAIDCISSIFINGKFVYKNENGYLPFSVDISSFVNLGENELRVEVLDSLDTNYPYGKQTNRRGGMWYTPVSGIWQTVWMESVPNNYIKNIKVTPTLNSVTIEVDGGLEDKKVVFDGETYSFTNPITINVKNPKLWTPETPNLYYFTVISGEDQVESYFALREIGINENGLTLNGKNYFFNGVLDQGYFPDGLFLPPNEQGFKGDILKMKELGFNMIRKHIKIEPAIFYYYCDVLGLAVFQDFVNNGKYSFIIDTALPTIGFKKCKPTVATKKQKEVFLEVSKKTVEHLYNYPSVVYYTIFNEGWGQQNATELYRIFKSLDATRVYDTASGWFNNCESDVKSEHVYFKKINVKNDGVKPLVLSEFGGYSYKINEHSFNLSNTYGYKKCTEKTFMFDLENLYYNEVKPCILSQKLCALVLTQAFDIEDETNGLYTYDRKVCKVDKQKMLTISSEMIKAYNNAVNK